MSVIAIERFLGLAYLTIIMIIDFHTHIWPDAVAPRALSALTASASNEYLPISDGTAGGLRQRMKEWHIDCSVVQPVITKQTQTIKTNEFAASINAANSTKPQLISFGGIWPHTDDYKRDIDFAVSLGLKGLKFHPEYQNFQVDDPEMFKIYEYALSCNLILLFHAGYDPAYKPPFRSNPLQFARVADAMQGGIIVAAHLGGEAQWDDVENILAGKNIYLDTSMGFSFYQHEQFLRIVAKHGSDRILFGSDSPWSNAGDEIAALSALPLSNADKDAILGGNAERILGL